MAVIPKTRGLYFPTDGLWMKKAIEKYARVHGLTFAQAVWALVEKGLRRYEQGA